MCKLIKSLYGLNQALKQWHEKFDSVLLKNDYVVNDAKICFYSTFEENIGVLICLYVDEMLIIGTNLHVVNVAKSFLASNSNIKDLGVADVILGIKLTKVANGILMSQEHYTKKFKNLVILIVNLCAHPMIIVFL